MAKKAAKKTTASKKTAVKKKAAATTTAPGTEVGRVQSGSPLDKSDKELTKKALVEIGQGMIDKKGRAPFKVTADVHEAGKRAKELNQERTDGEAELSATLYHLREKGAHTHEGLTKIEEYCDNVLNISPNKARQLIAAWEVFHSVLGLPNHLLSVIDWSKFKLFIPSVKSGAIKNTKAILEYLPIMVKTGPTRMTEAGIKREIQKLSGDGTSDATKLSGMKISMPEEEFEGFVDILSAYRESQGLASDSQAIARALDFAASASVTDAGARALGVMTLTNMIARANDVTPIIVANDPERETFDNLGVYPVSKIYGHFDTKSGNWGAMCLAASEEDAADHLNVKMAQVRAFDFTISDKLKPHATFEPRVPVPELDGDGSNVSDETLVNDTEDENEAVVDEKEIDLDDSLVGRYVLATYKGDDVNFVIVDVDVDAGTIGVKDVDDAWEPVEGKRKKSIPYASVVQFYEDDEEASSDEVEEEDQETEADEVEEGEIEESDEPEAATAVIPEFDPSDVDGMIGEVTRIGKLVKAKFGQVQAGRITSEHKAQMTKARASLKKAKDAATDPRTVALPALLEFVYKLVGELSLDISA